MSSGRPTILLVDDEPNILAALRRALRDERFELLGTTDPTEACVLIESESVDVMMADIQMPVMNGLDLVAEVRRRFPHVVRVLLTGNGNLDVALRAINEGEVYRFLTKPWVGDELRATLRQAVSRRQELLREAAASQLSDRRTALLAELEREHPGIAHIDLEDGLYVVDLARLEARVAEVGTGMLSAIVEAAGRPRSAIPG